ncbi:MAG: hypothetical protein HYS69_10725 [candidate division NC10 bacterium]|nr:hypothetical protein [candidate division NC10 bacterium]
MSIFTNLPGGAQQMDHCQWAGGGVDNSARDAIASVIVPERKRRVYRAPSTTNCGSKIVAFPGARNLGLDITTKPPGTIGWE